LNIGPVTAQATTTRHAMAKVEARPHCSDVHCAARLNAAPAVSGRRAEIRL
jgi:hypothetical protein